METEEQKQNFLRESILDVGYDAERFVAYMENEKRILAAKASSGDRLQAGWLDHG